MKKKLRKVTLQDKTDDIPITIFGNLVNLSINEGLTVRLTDLRVSKFKTTLLESSTFQVSDKEMSIDPKDLTDVNSKSIMQQLPV